MAPYRLEWYTKDIRSPWIPMSQASGEAMGVKVWSSVTPHSRVGSSWRAMGAKRESSKALLASVSVYAEKGREKGARGGIRTR